MPIALLLVALDVALVIHAAKTGRLNPWAYVILLLPGIGGLAYVAFELLPEWLRGPDGERAARHVANKLNPEKLYRDLTDQLEIADTVANRSALAAECLALGKFNEAEWHFDSILARPMGEEPIYALGKARAQFGAEHPLDAVATLDDLRTRWPDFQSVDGHLLYARALADGGRTEEALEEYQALAGYYPGAEAKVRYALLLQQVGRGADAKAVLAALLVQMRQAPKYVRKVQAEWIAIAEKQVRA
ncbi:MAG: hypothetical protein JWN71_3456 [Xanthobacteraceae bacterium]|nr:hypothetical protein [Xanthobacteraceae bacterium]